MSELKLKPRRPATTQSAAGAYGAMQARAVPGQQMPQATVAATTPQKQRGFFAVNWPLMTAAAALLGGGVVMGMAVGNAPRPQPAATVALAAPALSLAHYRDLTERTAGPVLKLVEALTASDPAKLATFRAAYDALTAQYFDRNSVRQDYLMTRAIKI